jgi:DNA-3-methyladenine glycosylase I
MSKPVTRCTWPGTDPQYVAYHDEEWGVPEQDDRALYEKLVLDGFQAGLAWITILRKRDAFRRAFDGFQPEKIARYDEKKVGRLLADPGIVRSRAKIEAAVRGARVYLDIMEKEPAGFSGYIWSFAEREKKGRKLRTMSDIPTQTDMSERLAKDLKQRGFKFCGPVIVYAFAQAVGMVNDHLVTCFRHAECDKLRKRALEPARPSRPT